MKKTEDMEITNELIEAVKTKMTFQKIQTNISGIALRRLRAHCSLIDRMAKSNDGSILRTDRHFDFFFLLLFKKTDKPIK